MSSEFDESKRDAKLTLRTLEFEREILENIIFLHVDLSSINFINGIIFNVTFGKNILIFYLFFPILRIELDLKVKHESFSRIIIFKIVIVERSVSI